MCKIKHFSCNLFSEFPICTGHNFNILGRITRDKYCNIKLLTQCGATIAAHTVFLDAFLKNFLSLLINTLNKEKLRSEMYNSKFPFRTPERPMSVHEHHFYKWEKDNSCKQDTLTDITVCIYRFLYRYTVLLYW